MMDKEVFSIIIAFGFRFSWQKRCFFALFLLPVVEKGFFSFGCEYGKINFEYEFQGVKRVSEKYRNQRF